MEFEFPKLEPKITKDFLLSKNSEETYMQTYLGVSVKKGLQISALRRDKKPTASFYRNKKGELIYHDFGIGFHGNFIAVVMYINNCDFKQALNIIGEDFGYISKSSDRKPIQIKQSSEVIDEKQETTIQIEKQDFPENELKWWESFGITLKTLQKFKVFSCKNIFLNDTYYCSSSKYNPIYGYYYGKRNSIELWKIYFPRKNSYRFLSNINNSIIQGAKQLPQNGDFLVITKSQKDVMLLYEIGIPAIAPHSETQFISTRQLNVLKQRFKHIIVCYDNDITGIHRMRIIKKQYPELNYFFIPRNLAKDPSDLYKKLHNPELFKSYVEQLKEYYAKKEN